MAGIKERYGALRQVLDERSRRLVVATESLAWGRGGLSVVSRATGVSRRVIRQGRSELKQPVARAVRRVRRPGGGRKRLAEKQPLLAEDLEQLVEPVTRGDPEWPLQAGFRI